MEGKRVKEKERESGGERGRGRGRRKIRKTVFVEREILKKRKKETFHQQLNTPHTKRAILSDIPRALDIVLFLLDFCFT